MTDWSTVASLATAAGTLVLALATFSSVRSAKRSTQVTERALLAGIRPVLVPTRLTDPPEKVGFVDQHWVKVDGQRAVLEVTPDAIYVTFTVRNVGAGIAVLDRWHLYTGDVMSDTPHLDPDDFTRLSRDLYIPAGDMGFWQGTFRDPTHARFAEVRQAIEDRQPMRVDLLYEDHEGGQRTISRFGIA
ncbi:MAG: hypothetical protein ACXWBN_12610, partial [Acidimicrobiales bacterium]